MLKHVQRLTLVVVFAAGLAAISNADTIYVPDDYPTIQVALWYAHDGDVIIVADGVWTGTRNKNIDFGGLAVTVRSENGPENCIIDCEDDGRGFYFHSGEGSDSVVDGFTIMNGSEAEYADGGGIYCKNSSPSIIRCVITYNSANARYGGGICCRGSSSPLIMSCVIANNTAYCGGGISSYGSDLCILNSVIAGNLAFDRGGGIDVSGGNPVIRNCVISNNLASASSDGGGGIYCFGDCVLTIINSTVTANLTNSIGGALLSHHSDVTISNCVLWGDTAVHGGPEIGLAAGSMLTVVFSDVEGGQANVYVGEGCTLEWGKGNFIADPLFVDSDGPDDDPNTWEDNDYHLSADSPCIDAGDPDFVSEPDGRDIDGQLRVWDGNDDGWWIVDTGSDEFASIIPGDFNGDGCVDQADLGILLSAWGIDDGGDLNGDGDTDQADLGVLLAHWGEGCP